MKTIRILIVILLFQLSGNAQQFEWLATPAITFGFNTEGIGYPTTSDSQGNVFVCGFKDTPLPYTDIFGNLWLLKYNSAGQLLFSKTITGSVNAYKMTVDAAGNLYIAAAYVNEITVDALHITTNFQGVKPILLKFNNNGDLLWHKSITGDFVDHFKSLTTDSTLNVYIGYDNFLDSHIERLDSEGNSLMTITQTSVKSIASVSVDTEGNIYATGSCAEMNVDFNGTGLINTLPYNTYLVKYNPYGQLQWMHFIEDVTCPEPQVVAHTPDEVYFSSYLTGNYNFGPITTEGPSNGANSDFFLTRLNSAGVFQWVKEVPGSGELMLGNRNFLTLDSHGNPYLTARFRGTIQWNPSLTTQSVNFNNDILVLKFNPQGDIVWGKTAGGTSEDRTDGITVLPDDSVIITGMVNGNVTFDALTHSSSGSNFYPYVAKISSSSLAIPTVTPHPVTLYPNPATTALTLSTPNYRGTAAIYSVLGQCLKVLNITTDETTMNTDDFAPGTYFIRTANQQVAKFIKL
ncbi:T9SS type A sorting domain-containing protein [Flavobacterium sp. XGLA_31]|uniref:T9SS type A sorting domain-containing protein n=1 Tax=Flavobacterium sp. XGLA_31 TaxID=3447666 RepID=UPI003F3A7DD5